MPAIVQPYAQFFDSQGNPLDNGALFFGSANLNPETSPITVYWDAALTQPAPQPIRTLSGYIVRSGSLAIVYADGNYSLSIKDKNGVLVAYAPDSNEYSSVDDIYGDLANTSSDTKGAGLVGFTPALTYPANTVGNYLSNLDANSLSFLLDATSAISIPSSVVLSSRVLLSSFPGVDPTGVADSTAGINLALAATRGTAAQTGKELHFGPGNYKVSGQLTIGTNQYITGTPKTVLTVTGTALGVNNVLFAISNQDQVHIHGNGMVIIGNRAALEAAGETAEGINCAFFFYGTTNFSLRDVKIFDFWTDCWTVDGDNTDSGACENGMIVNVWANNARRNCASIISAKNLVVQGGTYSNAGGGAGNPPGPWAGIDVEPNPNCFIENVSIRNIRTYNCKGGGLVFAPGALATTGSASNLYQVSVDSWISTNDGLPDTNNIAALLYIVGNGTLGTINKKLYGYVSVRDAVIESPLGRGMSAYNWDADYLVECLLDNVKVYNPNAFGGVASNANCSGFVIYADSGQTTTNTIGGFTFNNCLAEDRRSSPSMTWGFMFEADGTKNVKSLRYFDCFSRNFIATDKSHVSTQGCVAKPPSYVANAVDCTVNFSSPAVLNASGSRNISTSGGMTIRSTVNSSDFTLPMSISATGMPFIVQSAVGVTGTNIKTDSVLAPADRLVLNGAAATTIAGVAAGTSIKARTNSAGDTVFSSTYTQ